MKIDVKGSEEYALKLSKLASGVKGIAGKAIYKAADVVTDAVRAQINSLPTVDENYNILAYHQGLKARLSERQKQGLLDGLGVAKMKETDGYYNVKVGFDGYNDIKTRKYPQGQPNVLIARIYENGGSTAEKMPFIKPALNKVRKQAVEIMNKTVDEEIEKQMR